MIMDVVAATWQTHRKAAERLMVTPARLPLP